LIVVSKVEPKFIDRLAALSPKQQELLRAKVRRREPSNDVAGAEPPLPAARDRDLPLSFSQQRLWFIDQFEPFSAAYNISFAFRLEGTLAVPALERALNTTIERHEVLRTRFKPVDGRPVQVIDRERSLQLTIIDLSTLSDTPGAGELEQRLKEAGAQPFDLSCDLMLRARLFRTDGADHVLCVTMHHIASDGWSLEIFFNELTRLYNAFQHGQTSPLPPLAIQYGDFAVWQREILQGRLRNDREYWQQQLAGAPTLLELPTDYRRPAVQAFRGAHEYFHFPKELGLALEGLRQGQGATLFMTLLAAFQMLLSRYSGQDEIVVGCPVAGRTRIETEPMIGFFVNTLALRTNMTGDPTFRELLGRVREVTMAAYEHRELPFEKLLEELKPQRRMSHTPLFQVMFTLHHGSRFRGEFEGLKRTPIPIETNTAKFDLTLRMTDAPDGLRGSMEYRTDLFQPGTVQGLLENFRRLLDHVVANPDRRLSAYHLLSDDERAQILEHWNDTQTAYPLDQSIHELFEQQVERGPDRVALQSGAAALTYGVLNERANQLAHHLTGLGFVEGKAVGLFLKRSLEMVVGMLGILKAGAAYLPLDPAYPPDRLAFMLEDAGAELFLTMSALSQVLPVRARVVCLDSDWPQIGQMSTAAPAGECSGDSLAYVIYTSGSTGTPKGVAVLHKAVSRLVMSTNYIALESEDVVGQASSASFDAITFELWGALLNGARLNIIPRDKVLSPNGLAQEIDRLDVTTLFLTTSLFQQLARENPTSFRRLRTLLFGGETSDRESVRLVAQEGLPGRLLHVYGPTETTTFATWHPLTALTPHADRLPIGRPISNSKIYVLDARLEPCPVGMPGEIYIGGDGLAREYLGRPELTADKFVPHPFTSEQGTRLYKTRDRARQLAGGEIDFLGRADRQVKIRGFRVEPGEIEAFLRDRSDVRDAAVEVYGIDPLAKRLVAYLVFETGNIASHADLRHYLAQRLPDFMIPSDFVSIERLPLTANGKLDRSALPAPSKERPSLQDQYSAPRSVMEKTVAAIWCELLSKDRVGIHDDFFELGGHSLKAVEMLTRVEEATGKRLPLSKLFEEPKIYRIARTLEGLDHPTERPWLVEIQPHGTRPPVLFLPSLWGTLSTPKRIARHLPPDQPVFGIQPPRLDGSLAAFKSLEATVAYYVEKLRSVWPDTPLCLFGYSYAGTLAYEMARQLTDKGGSVALLGIIDTGPGRRLLSLSDRLRVARYCCRNLPRWIRDVVLGFNTDEMARRTRVRLRKFVRRIQSRKRPGLEEIVDVELLSNQERQFLGTQLEALRRYVPKPHRGRVTLFRTQTLHRIYGLEPEPDYGWGNLVPEVELIFIPGDHTSIVWDHVNDLAIAVRTALANIRPGAAETE